MSRSSPPRSALPRVVLDGVTGALCAEFDRAAWSAALAPHLAAADPRISGRAHAEPFSSDTMALRVLDTWRELLGDPPRPAMPPPVAPSPSPVAAPAPGTASPPVDAPALGTASPPVDAPAPGAGTPSPEPRSWLIPLAIMGGVAAVFLVVFLIVLSNLTSDANRQAAAQAPAPAASAPHP